jgi:hypothetical protein
MTILMEGILWKSGMFKMLDASLVPESQIVTKDGAEAAAKPSLKDLLLSDAGRGDLVLPERGQARGCKRSRYL